MTTPTETPFDIFLKEFRQVVREEIAAALQNGGLTNSEKDALLTPEQAANLIGVDRRWLYRHAVKLPFARRISRKNLRFSEAGLRRWVTTKKPGSPR